MSEFTALCERTAICIVCGEPFTDTHKNIGHAAPIIAKAMKDYKDGLRRGDEDGWDWKVMKEPVLANIEKVSKAFVMGYRKGVQDAAYDQEDHSPPDRLEDGSEDGFMPDRTFLSRRWI